MTPNYKLFEKALREKFPFVRRVNKIFPVDTFRFPQCKRWIRSYHVKVNPSPEASGLIVHLYSKRIYTFPYVDINSLQKEKFFIDILGFHYVEILL